MADVAITPTELEAEVASADILDADGTAITPKHVTRELA